MIKINFEYKLKQKLQSQILEKIRRELKFILEENMITNTNGYKNEWTEVLTGIEDLIYAYTEKYTNLPIEQAIEIYERFFESVSNESLNNMKKGIQLTKEEEIYMIHEGTYYHRGDRISPISKVLLRRKLIEFVKEHMEIDKLFEILKTESEFKIKQKEYIYELITGGFFKSEEELQKRIEEEANSWFNDRINCGGYALELDTCIYNYSYDFEKAVSELLEKVTFIRLLGDKKLADDEYLVIWKVNQGGGHHFVKVQEDGTIIEKDGSDPITMFSGWSPSLEGCPEAVFAVKKEHDMHFEDKDFESISIEGKCGLNFEETVHKAIQTQKNSFEYHNHSYELKKDKDGCIYICSEGRIIADVFIDDGECLVDIADAEKKYVSNTQPPVPLCIKDGKIQNNNIESSEEIKGI